MCSYYLHPRVAQAEKFRKFSIFKHQLDECFLIWRSFLSYHRKFGCQFEAENMDEIGWFWMSPFEHRGRRRRRNCCCIYCCPIWSRWSQRRVTSNSNTYLFRRRHCHLIIYVEWSMIWYLKRVFFTQKNFLNRLTRRLSEVCFEVFFKSLMG